MKAFRSGYSYGSTVKGANMSVAFDFCHYLDLLRQQEEGPTMTAEPHTETADMSGKQENVSELLKSVLIVSEIFAGIQNLLEIEKKERLKAEQAVVHEHAKVAELQKKIDATKAEIDEDHETQLEHLLEDTRSFLTRLTESDFCDDESTKKTLRDIYDQLDYAHHLDDEPLLNPTNGIDLHGDSWMFEEKEDDEVIFVNFVECLQLFLIF